MPIVPDSKGAPPQLPVTTGRNSIGDLKMPSRISQAQVGIRRDLRMVREFAANVGCEFKNKLSLVAFYHASIQNAKNYN
jgi:hypothetical protein